MKHMIKFLVIISWTTSIEQDNNKLIMCGYKNHIQKQKRRLNGREAEVLKELHAKRNEMTNLFP